MLRLRRGRGWLYSWGFYQSANWKFDCKNWTKLVKTPDWCNFFFSAYRYILESFYLFLRRQYPNSYPPPPKKKTKERRRSGTPLNIRLYFKLNLYWNIYYIYIPYDSNAFSANQYHDLISGAILMYYYYYLIGVVVNVVVVIVK